MSEVDGFVNGKAEKLGEAKKKSLTFTAFYVFSIYFLFCLYYC